MAFFSRSGFHSRGLWILFQLAFYAGMIKYILPKEVCGNSSASAHRKEGSTSNLSSRRDHGDGAEGTARVKKRKVRTPWSDKNTEQLLRAYRKRMDESGRFMRSVDWQSISESVDGMAGKDCQRRMDTLTKSFNSIKKHCGALQKRFSQITEEEFRSLKLGTKMEENWYDQLCEIKMQPQNAMVVPSPDSGDQSMTSSPQFNNVFINLHIASLLDSIWIFLVSLSWSSLVQGDAICKKLVLFVVLSSTSSTRTCKDIGYAF